MALPRIKEVRAYVKRAADVDQGMYLDLASWQATSPAPSQVLTVMMWWTSIGSTATPHQ